jgi:hypothetical protein
MPVEPGSSQSTFDGKQAILGRAQIERIQQPRSAIDDGGDAAGLGELIDLVLK